MIKEMLIRDFDGDVFSFEDFKREMERYLSLDYKICIGSDSQMYFDHTIMVTAIVVINKFKGNNCFYLKEKVPNEKYPTLRMRISDEAFRSIQAGIEIKEMFDCDISIHLDIGDDPKRNKTHEFVGELTGIVTSQGFSVKIKPESFASSGFADWFTK